MNRAHHVLGVVTDRRGNSLPGWQVECVVLDSSTPVDIFADENDTPIVSVSGVANRALADADGNYDFFVEAGVYGLRYYDTNGVFQRAQRFIRMDGLSPAAEEVASSNVPWAQTGTGAISRDVESRLREVVSVLDFIPVNLHAAIAAHTSTADVTAYFTAALAAIQARGGGTLRVPNGGYRLNSALTVNFDGLTIAGDGAYRSQLLINHDGVGLTYTAGVNNLPDGKFHMHGLGFVNQRGYPLDGAGFPQATHLGTAFKLVNCYGSTFIDLFVEGFDKSHDLDDCALLTFIGFTDRNCWTGRYFQGYTNTVAYFGGVINNSSIDSYRDEVKMISFMGVDIEAASRTCQIGTANIFNNCRLERLHIARTWFKWFQVNGDDNIFDAGCRWFWDGSALPGSGDSQFFVEVAGRNNELHFAYLFNHEKVIKLTSASSANTVVFASGFKDYENSGNSDSYRFSRRYFVDAGTNNKIIHRSSLMTAEAVGGAHFKATGQLNTYLRNNALSNMTITGATLTVAASDLAGPFGLPTTSENVKKITLNAGAVKRAQIDPSLVANGSTTYTLAVYVRMPSGGTQPTRIRLGVGDGNFVDVLPEDGTDMWHRVVLYHKAVNTTAIKFTIDAEGDVGDVFYLACPSLAVGESLSFIDRKWNETSNTQATANSFDSDNFRYSTLEETGTFNAGIKVGATAQSTVSTCSYVRRGNRVEVNGTVAMTAAVSGTGSLAITGLPYAISSTASYGEGAANITLANVSFSGSPSATLVVGGTDISLLQTADAGGLSALTHTNLASNSQIYFSAQYTV